MRISGLKQAHQGQTIWVLGSGSSLGHIDSAFFDDKLTIGVNLVSVTYARTNYSVTKYHSAAEELIAHYGADHRGTIVSEHEHGNHSKSAFDLDRPDCWVFEHNDNPGDRFASADWPDEGAIVASHSTIGSAIHLAAYMGASSCVLVGHDSGVLDLHQHVLGYVPAAPDALWHQYPSFERQSIVIKDEVRRRYGTHVYSLNPFINFNLEGHSFYSRTNHINMSTVQAAALSIRAATASRPSAVTVAKKVAVRARALVRGR